MDVEWSVAQSDRSKPLILGLGNDLIADDGFGILAAKEFEVCFKDRADVVGTAVHGVALLDEFLGYDQVIVVDVIQTGACPCGTVMELDAASFRPVASPSPHYTGLPEMLELAERLELAFPRTVRLFAVEARDVLTLGGPMSAEVAAALPELRRRVAEALDDFEQARATSARVGSTEKPQP